MEKKYKLTEETIKVYDKTLYRIEALRDFGDVKKGDKGGFLEKEDNLSQSGDCWVYGNARVYNNAVVYDNVMQRSMAMPLSIIMQRFVATQRSMPLRNSVIKRKTLNRNGWGFFFIIFPHY